MPNSVVNLAESTRIAAPLAGAGVPAVTEAERADLTRLTALERRVLTMGVGDPIGMGALLARIEALERRRFCNNWQCPGHDAALMTGGLGESHKTCPRCKKTYVLDCDEDADFVYHRQSGCTKSYCGIITCGECYKDGDYDNSCCESEDDEGGGGGGDRLTWDEEQWCYNYDFHWGDNGKYIPGAFFGTCVINGTVREQKFMRDNEDMWWCHLCWMGVKEKYKVGAKQPKKNEKHEDLDVKHERRAAAAAAAPATAVTEPPSTASVSDAPASSAAATPADTPAAPSNE